MAVTTNNRVQFTLMYEDYSTQNYAFDGVPDNQIEGLKTRIQTANQNWGLNTGGYMANVFVKANPENQAYGNVRSMGIHAAQVTSTEEEVIYGG